MEAAAALHPFLTGEGATPEPSKKEAELARALTLSALYFMALGTMFGAYALSL